VSLRSVWWENEQVLGWRAGLVAGELSMTLEEVMVEGGKEN
jgi:hypothetical protein